MNYEKLASKIASSYEVQDGITREDLVQSALLGVLEAEARWEEDLGVSFTTMAYRYAKNELNNLIYRQTTRENLPVRLTRNREMPQGLLEEDIISDDENYFNKLRDEIFQVAEDRLDNSEYEMFCDLYHNGDWIAVNNYKQRHEVSRKVAYNVKLRVREKMQGVI